MVVFSGVNSFDSVSDLRGKELIWDAVMMIYICDIAPAVAGV